MQDGGETDDPTQFGRIIEQEFGEGQQIDKDQTVGVTIATGLGNGGG